MHQQQQHQISQWHWYRKKKRYGVKIRMRPKCEIKLYGKSFRALWSTNSSFEKLVQFACEMRLFHIENVQPVDGDDDDNDTDRFEICFCRFEKHNLNKSLPYGCRFVVFVLFPIFLFGCLCSCIRIDFIPFLYHFEFQPLSLYQPMKLHTFLGW